MSPLSPVVPVCPSRVIQHNTKQQHVHDYHPPQVQRLHKKTHGPLVKAFAFEVFLTITDFKGALMENATDKQILLWLRKKMGFGHLLCYAKFTYLRSMGGLEVGVKKFLCFFFCFLKGRLVRLAKDVTGVDSGRLASGVGRPT